MNTIYVANHAFVDDVDAIHDDPGEVDIFMMSYPNNLDPAFTQLTDAEWMYVRDTLVKEYREMCDDQVGVITWTPIDDSAPNLWSQKMYDDGELVAMIQIKSIGLI